MSRSRRVAAAVVAAGVVIGGAVAASAPAQAAAGSRVAHYGPPNVAAASSTAVLPDGSSTPTTVSHNWSGYSVTSRTPYTYVHATFVQPAVTCAGRPFQWTSNWVGLDGYNDNTVEQDGTFAHCGGTGWTTPSYFAWYEMYPAGSVSVFRVNPGDVIDTVVSATTAGRFTLTVSDLSTGRTATKKASCSPARCSRTSAEWIVERPALCADDTLSNCFLTELADFGSTSMSGAEEQQQGGAVRGLNSVVRHPIDMVDTADGGGFISLDGVGAVSGQSFPAQWYRSGNIYPISLS